MFLRVAGRRSNTVPVYRQIAMALQARITGGEWVGGEQLPTEPILSGEFGVNRLTVRQALGELVRAGSIVVLHGKGAFVATQSMRVEVEVDAASQRVDVGSMQSILAEVEGEAEERLVDSGSGVDPMAIAYLGADAADLLRVDTIYGPHGEPAVFSTYWLDGGRVPGLASRWTADSTLLEVIREVYGITLRYDWRGFTAVAAGLVESARLHVDVGSPLLVRDGVSIDDAGAPFYYVRRYIPGDRIKYVLRYRAASAPSPRS